jgi:hypothetical protein
MRYRRDAFALMAVLVLVLTVLIWWLAAQIEALNARLACGPLASGCESSESGLSPLVTLAIFAVGGLFALGFAWLAWQEALDMKKKKRRSTQLRVFDATHMMVPLPDDDPHKPDS